MALELPMRSPRREIALAWYGSVMDEQAACIIETVRAALPEVYAIYRFGSFERGDATPSSDVDIAVLARRPLDAVTRWEVAQTLASQLGRDVDLVDMRGATAVFRAQVLDHGSVLFDGAPRERALFETRAMSEYAHLNEERRDILRDIEARGTIHG